MISQFSRPTQKLRKSSQDCSISLRRLKVAHQKSVVRHVKILSEERNAAAKILRYFIDLQYDLEKRNFQIEPELKASPSEEKSIFLEIRQHKECVRQFFITLSLDVSGDPRRSVQLGEQLFLLYFGAAAEAQSFRDAWPVKRAIISAADLLEQEQDRVYQHNNAA